jgi:hypothetical protein
MRSWRPRSPGKMTEPCQRRASSAPRPRYEVAPDLWVIAAYYNPHGYQTRAHNYALFATSLARSGIPLLTVECAFGDEPFVLSDSATVLKLRCQSVLWQKERLLNVAIATLPPTCTKVAWLDADILFERPRLGHPDLATPRPLHHRPGLRAGHPPAPPPHRIPRQRRGHRRLCPQLQPPQRNPPWRPLPRARSHRLWLGRSPRHLAAHRPVRHRLVRQRRPLDCPRCRR